MRYPGSILLYCLSQLILAGCLLAFSQAFSVLSTVSVWTSSSAPHRRLLLRLHSTDGNTDSSSSSSSENTDTPAFFATTTATSNSNSNNDLANVEFALPQDDPQFANAEFLDVSLSPHRPLGCTVEESLGSGNYIFFSKVNPDSNGAKGGLQEGDVIVACSNMFGDGLAVVVSLDSVAANKNNNMMDQILDLVAARPDHETLQLRIARNTKVMAQHETALVELCSNPGASDTEVETCLFEYLKEGYAMPTTEADMSSKKGDNGDDALCDPDEDDDCLLDGAFDLWNQDYSYVEPKEQPDAQPKEEPKPAKAKPWSSRSSPSGTFVRDPKTGKLINIDPK